MTQSSLNTLNPTPIDILANTRDRNTRIDSRLDTFINLQYPANLKVSKFPA